ncbi:MAG TPA: CBS domain-containing protein [Acidimicrobiales bacterium]|nr:CBS domain-containing protein [Acidimicrobiales bacterium]
MRTIDAVRRSGIGIGPDRTVREAAEIMEQTGVGSLAIVEDGKLVGIVTDRDLVRRALARGFPGDARIDAVMSSPAITIAADEDVHRAFAMFRTHGIRRLAVERDGAFVGMLTIDDLLVDLAGDLADLARPITAEILFAHRDASVPISI